ncbi:MarR family transcriptional regulator [Leucobacter zeae]|nr:MarR family transcriptional regulator [Leucobacter zeae]
MTHIEEATGRGGAAAVALPVEEGGTVAEIIAEFSEIFAFARTKWARYAEEVHPDLRGVGMMVLQLVLRKGPVTATGISQLLDMDKAMVSRQISKLRELGLVAAEPAAEDRRVILLTGSERAEEMLDGIRRQWAHAYHERFDGWSPADLETLRAGLHRFNASAESGRPDGPARRCAREHAQDAQSAD